MFTGIVKGTGRVVALERDPARIRIETELARELRPGDSLAVGGACLTVASGGAGREVEAELMAETLARTTLGDLAPGDRVNLEPPLRASDPLGGHIVQGHVDGVGTVEAQEGDGAGTGRTLRVSIPPDLLRYTVPQGSIALDGVSLTLAEAGADAVSVGLTGETLARTTLGDLAPGDRVNVEVDVLAKYVERLAAPLVEARA